jgi:predicted nucleic acid-binding protein
MSKDKLYLDTSVPSAYFGERSRVRMQITQAFWLRALLEYDVAVSDVTQYEILKTKDPKRRTDMFELVQSLTQFAVTPRTEVLRLNYLAGNLVPRRKLEDPQHIAVAVENGFDYLVSWNFEHMVNAKTQKLLPVLNAKNGYFKQLVIVTPEAFPEMRQS